MYYSMRTLMAVGFRGEYCFSPLADRGLLEHEIVTVCSAIRGIFADTSSQAQGLVFFNTPGGFPCAAPTAHVCLAFH